MLKKIGIGVAALGAVLFGVYLRVIRPWQLRWGATNEEVARAMPGDDVVKRPTFNATRAVTIQARPEEIWPWLVQIGVTRAGWYSYDWLDNLGKPSAAAHPPPIPAGGSRRRGTVQSRWKTGHARQGVRTESVDALVGQQR